MTSYYSSSNALSFVNMIKMRQSKDQPLDSISCIVNDPYRVNEHGFVTGSWDGCIRYYLIPPKNVQEIQLAYVKFLQHPVLSVAFGVNNMIFAGLANGDIWVVDPANDSLGKVGGHQAPICSIFYVEKFNLLVSLGFDSLIRFWSLENSNNGNFLVKQFQLPTKTHTVAYDFPYMLIGTIQGKVYILNMDQLPNLNIPALNQMTQLLEAGSKMTAAKIDAKSKLYAIGCVDGRCAFGQFQDGYSGPRIPIDTSKRMLSKSMKRQSSYNSSPNYGQVNDIDIGFYENQSYLVISGTQQASFFNILKKDKPKRIKQKCTAGRITLDGKYFIYAIGNDWCEGFFDLKKNLKPKIQAIRFSTSQSESFVRNK